MEIDSDDEKSVSVSRANLLAANDVAIEIDFRSPDSQPLQVRTHPLRDLDFFLKDEYVVVPELFRRRYDGRFGTDHNQEERGDSGLCHSCTEARYGLDRNDFRILLCIAKGITACRIIDEVLLPGISTRQG